MGCRKWSKYSGELSTRIDGYKFFVLMDDRINITKINE
jgi:hypothetical protein